VSSINWEQSDLHVVVLKNGKANYDIMLKDTSATSDTDTSSQVNLGLGKIMMSKSNVLFEDLGLDFHADIKGIHHIGTGDFQKDIFDYNTETVLDEVTIDYGKVRYFYKKRVAIFMEMKMNLQDLLFTFKENIIHINDFKFKMEGNFGMMTHGYSMDLKFASKETTFKNILSLVPGVYMKDFKQVSTSGDLAFKGFVKGTYSDTSARIPAFHVELKVIDAVFKLDSLPTPVKNIQMDMVVDNPYGIVDSTLLDIRTFHMDLGKHPVHGRLKVQGISQYKLDADIMADLDLAELETMFPMKGLDLKGKLNFEWKAKGLYKTTEGVKNKKKTTELLALPAMHLNLKLSDGRLKYDSLPTAIENVQLHLVADNETGQLENTVVEVKSLHLDMGKNPIHGTARVSGYKKYQVDADIKASLDLADIEKMYPMDSMQMAGMFDLDVKAKGVYDPLAKIFPALDAKMNLTNGYVKVKEYPEPIQNMHLVAEATNKTGKVSDTKLIISKLTYTLEDEPFTVSGTLADLDKYNYDLKIKGLVDLEKMTKIYPVEGLKLKGLVDTDIETNGCLADVEAGKYYKVSSKGSVEFKNIEVSGKEIPRKIWIQNAFFSFTPSKIVLERFKGLFGRSNVSITGDISNYMAFLTKGNELIKGDMDLKSDTLDLNEWIADSSTSKSAPHSASTPSVVQVPLNVDFIFDSEISTLIFQDMKLTKMDGEIRIKDGVLSMKETGFNTLNALFSLSGDYDTRDLKHPLFDFILNIKELDINKAYREVKMFRDMAPAAANTFGLFSIDYKLKGELAQDMSPITQSLVGGGVIRIADAKVNGMKLMEEISKSAKKKEINDPHLKDLVMETEIKDNNIYVKPFSLDLSGLNTEIEGVSEINGAIHYIVKIELIEKLKVPFHVTGTYDKPKVALGKGHTLPAEVQ
jgi:AsmA protein